MSRLSAANAGVVSTLILSLLAAPLVAGDSWTSFRGPRGTGEALEGLPPGEGPVALRLAWKKPLGSGYSGISIADGKAVTAFTDGEKDILVALDLVSGSEVWRAEIGPIYPGYDGAHDGPVSTPAIAGGRVFMLDPAGRFAAFDLGDGRRIWSTDLVADHGSGKLTYGFGSSPLVVDDLVILLIGGEAGAVAAFDVSTGDLRWRSIEDIVGYGSQSPVIAEVAGRRQLPVLTRTKLSGLDPADGTILWDVEHEAERNAMGSSTASPMPIGNNRVFVKYDDPESAVFELVEVDGAMGAARVATSKAMTRSYSPATVSGDHVYGYTARFLSAADPTSGEMLWRTRAVGDGFIISIGDQLAIIQKTGTLHLGGASPEGWTEASQVDLFEDLAWTPPSYHDGAIYLRSFGEIARVDIVREAPQRIAAIGLPAALAGLAERVQDADDPPAVVDEFLDGRSLPLVDGDEAIFIWRGEADDVAVAGDMIGARREEKMERLEGTDLWWWATELDSRARINYLFYPDYEPSVDPSHDRVVKSTSLAADMNFTFGDSDKGVRMSWFAMPEWPGLTASSEEPESRGRLETLELMVQPSAAEGEDAPEPVPVPATVWLPPGYDSGDERYPVVYVANPEAVEAGGWPAALDRSIGRTVEPLIVVFPEMPQQPGLRGALSGQIVPQIDERFRTRADRESRALVGMAFPGYGAALTAFSASDTFGALGVQSLWILEGGMKEGFKGVIGQKEPGTTPMRIYLEWGRWDMISPHEGVDFRQSSRWAWDYFVERGYQPTGGEVWDSHDYSSWSNRTGVMLQALFPMKGAESELGDWQTGAP